MNTFLENLTDEYNYKLTENGGLAHSSTMQAVYDLFAFGGSYRTRSDSDCITLFSNALNENTELAMKCLFWIRDARGGAGERRFFRVCLTWLANEHPDIARRNLKFVPEMGRWDDLYCLMDTPLEIDALRMIENQLKQDLASYKASPREAVSLCAKWVPSENASNKTTIQNAKKTRTYLHLTSRQYRKMLSLLRERIKILEKLMSQNRWDEIDFAKIPGRAGFIYRNAFARNDMTAARYQEFIKNKKTKVHADTLFPYEIVKKALQNRYSCLNIDRLAINKYWENQKDYFDGKPCSMICVVDTSGSMYGDPINVAISLGMYCAERNRGPFKDYFITFSRKPQLVHIEGVDFCDKVRRIRNMNICENTNLEAVFEMLLDIACKPTAKREDIPKSVCVISDMEIDSAQYTSGWYTSYPERLTEYRNNVDTMMENMRKKWAAYGLKLPRLIYWNVNARNNTILDRGPDVSYVSGLSPAIFSQVITGKNGWELCLDAITAARYKGIK